MQIIVRTLCGLAVLPVLGCHSFSPHGPGYAGNYPTQPRGGYPQQGATYPQPALAMNTVPGQTWPQQQMGVPVGTPPQYAAQPQQFSQTPPPASGSASPKPVPDYDDIPGRASAATTDGSDDFRDPLSARNLRGAKLDAGIDDSDAGDPADDAFAPPVPVQNASASRDLPDDLPVASRGAVNPYMYDTKKYTWLRGVVDFDDLSKTWRITYNPDPRADQWGGSLTLGDDEKLGSLLPNDVVLVEGHIDNDRRDRLSKPVYHVTNAVRLVPKNAP